MTVAPLPSSSSHLRVPFIFVPDGTASRTALAQFKADYPGWVTFRATFRPRPGPSPLVTTIPPMPVVEAQTRPQETVRGPWPRSTGARLHGARLHGTRLAAPRIVEPWQPPPRLPSSQAPLPAAYTGPQSLTGAFVGSMASATSRAALIRPTQAMLDNLAGQAARGAAIAEFMNPAAVAGAILLTPTPAGAGEEQALRRALADLKAKGRQHFDMPPPSPPLPGLVPPPLPRRKPGEGGFTPTPAEKPLPGFTPAPPPILLRPGRPPVANTPVILDSRKTEPSHSGETELSRILAPGGQPVGWVERRTKLNIRTVTATQFAALKEELLKNAAGPESDKDYDGKVYQLPDGERFGLRISKNHGETIDVMSRATTQLDRNLKIHWNPGNDRRTKAP